MAAIQHHGTARVDKPAEAEAEAATQRLAAAPTDDRLPVRDIRLLRLRALVAGAR